MNKQEYIENNQYLRKGFENLTEEDKAFMVEVGQGKINPTSKNSIVRFKQVMYHMQKGMSLWEMRGLLKAFKFLEKLPN